MSKPAAPVLLLAGSWGGERESPARGGGQAGWHLPPHVRDPSEARRRLAEQVRAGADAIVAPTFWTSRPALARFGEARRAREWTQLAVRLAREATEEAGRGVLVCGSIMAAAEDFEAHAGTVAEAGVDVLLVEAMSSVAQARTATMAAAATGLPVWGGARLDSGEWLGEWAEALEPARPERLLVCGAPEPVAAGLEELGRLTSRPLGVLLNIPATKDETAALLERGATLLGLADGATPEAVRSLREAIDARLKAESEALTAERSAWEAWLERAAAWAPGGPALWLGDEPDQPLPAGFAWTVAPADDAGRLPQDHYRLVVVGQSDGSGVSAGVLPGLLEKGGILLMPGVAESGFARVLDRSDDPPLTILRRD